MTSLNSAEYSQAGNEITAGFSIEANSLSPKRPSKESLIIWAFVLKSIRSNWAEIDLKKDFGAVRAGPE